MIHKQNKSLRHKSNDAQNCPSPEQICALTEEIRKSWSQREHRTRASLGNSSTCVFEMPLMPRRRGFDIGNH